MLGTPQDRFTGHQRLTKAFLLLLIDLLVKIGEGRVTDKMMTRTKGNTSIIVVVSLCLSLFLPACLLAGGAQHYPLGSESDLMGCLPPPGFYSKTYFYFYTASDLKDNSGDTIRLAKDGSELNHLDVYSIAPKLVWVSEKKILGWNYGQQLIVPLVKVDMKLDTLGGSLHEDRFSVADIRWAPLFMSWHSKNGLLHSIAALNIDFPTGAYKSGRLVNIGKNSWSISPGLSFTAFVPQNPKISVNMFLQYAFNTSNDDYVIGPSQASKIGNMGLTGARTHLTPGQEFMFDYAIGYGLTKNLRADIAGYYYQQITNDRTGRGTIGNDKGKVFSVGPGIVYAYNNLFFDFHVAFETAAKNRPQGVTGLFSFVYCFDKTESAKK